MKTLHLPFVIGLSGFLLSCGTKKNPEFLTVHQLAKIQQAPTLKAKKVTIRCKIIEPDGSVKSLPKATTRIGKAVSIELYREYTYPTAYHLPKTIKPSMLNGKIFPVTPSTPKKFATANLGNFLTVTPVVRGSLIEIKGTLISRSIDDHVFAAGEAYSPLSVMTDKNQEIIVTENKAVAPEFTETTNSILVCGRPDIEHTMYLKNQRRKLVFTMTVAK